MQLEWRGRIGHTLIYADMRVLRMIDNQQRIIIDIVGLPVFVSQAQIVVAVPRCKLIPIDFELLLGLLNRFQ